jgi:hypothetical protein
MNGREKKHPGIAIAAEAVSALGLGLRQSQALFIPPA